MDAGLIALAGLRDAGGHHSSCSEKIPCHESATTDSFWEATERLTTTKQTEVTGGF